MKEENTAFLERIKHFLKEQIVVGQVKVIGNHLAMLQKMFRSSFLLASENLASMGFPLSYKLADCECRKLKGFHVDNARKLNARQNDAACFWFHSQHVGMLDECPSVVAKNDSISSSVTFADGWVFIILQFVLCFEL